MGQQRKREIRSAYQEAGRCVVGRRFGYRWIIWTFVLTGIVAERGPHRVGFLTVQASMDYSTLRYALRVRWRKR